MGRRAQACDEVVPRALSRPLCCRLAPSSDLGQESPLWDRDVVVSLWRVSWWFWGLCPDVTLISKVHARTIKPQNLDSGTRGCLNRSRKHSWRSKFGKPGRDGGIVKMSYFTVITSPVACTPGPVVFWPRFASTVTYTARHMQNLVVAIETNGVDPESTQVKRTARLSAAKHSFTCD